MEETCKYFIGKHDFSAFKTNGSSVKTTVRTISDLHIERDKEFIKIFVTADGFLYNMVRIIVGTLVEVGLGKKKPEEVLSAINTGNREESGHCAPPNGLVLEKVYY